MKNQAAVAAFGRGWGALSGQLCRLPSGASAAAAARQAHTAPAGDAMIRWVFLGPPGVGKGTYASRVAERLGVPHIAAGDLVRAEIKSGSALGNEMKVVVNAGRLLPDDLVLDVLRRRLAAGAAAGERGFILDGYPRTASQATALSGFAAVQLAVNLTLREEVLVEKCLGRRICGHCGKNYNVADIRLAADPAKGQPQIVMPPLSPPPSCAPHLEQRADDTEPVVRKRLEVYKAEASPVEEYFRAAGTLMEFEITGGIPETLPRLLAALAPHMPPPQATEQQLPPPASGEAAAASIGSR